MERRGFFKKSAAVAGTVFAAGQLSAGEVGSYEKDLYEMKVYQFSGGGGVNQLKKYYTDALIPFLNKQGVKVGAFREYGMEEPPRVYMLHAYRDPLDYWNATRDMRTDSVFLKAAGNYFGLPAANPVFERYDTFIMSAFQGLPQLSMPAKNRGLFELRIYESHNEEAFWRKVRMFNNEELPLFKKVGLHPFFFGEIMAGRHMPALAYMLWFKDMEERDANWKTFVTSEEWKIMSNKEEYAHTVSKVRRIFLTPMDFSQF